MCVVNFPTFYKKNVFPNMLQLADDRWTVDVDFRKRSRTKNCGNIYRGKS